MEQQRSRMHSAHFFHVDLDNNEEEEEDGSGTSASNEEDNTETECSDEELTSLHLTLENFDNDQIPDDCPFVLTSPRSLEACKLVGVRPVDLLPFRLQDARRELEDNGDFTIEALHLLRKAEDERRELLDQCRDLRNQLILEQDEDSNSNSSNPDEITTDSGKGCTSEGSQGSSDSERSSPDRDPKSLRFRKTNLHSRITNEVLDLSKIDQDPEEQTSRRTSSVTFCNEPDLVLHLDTTNNPHRPNSFSKKLFCNPYGPPLYPRQRFLNNLPLISKKKRKAKRTQKMITIKVAQEKMEQDKRSSLMLKSKRAISLPKAKLDNFQRLLETHDLLDHDRRMLQLLASKKLEEWEKDRSAHTFRQKWAQEYLLWKKNKENHELLWQKELKSKRKRESESNESRLFDMRNQVMQAQNHLKCLIHQKQLKYDQLAQRAQRLKLEQIIEWRKQEDSKRLTVESALNELLARDTQYRKELKAHIENRLQQAEKRRQRILAASVEKLNALHTEQVHNQRSRISDLSKRHLLHIEAVREAIRVKLAKAEAILERKKDQQRDPDHHRFSKVLCLKQELESKFQSWRKQVLQVQMKSLEMAEKRARLYLDQRSLRVRSETRSRRAKHEALLKKVEEDEDSRKNATLRHLSARMSLFDQWQIKRKQEHHDIMQKVQKAAKLRQAILSMTSKEVQKSSSLQLEVQLTKILEPSQCNPVSV